MDNDKKFVDFDSVFATRLRSLMESNKTTQKELSEIVGTTRQAISQYADGSVQPNIEKLYKMASYFKVSSDWLIGMNDIKSPDIDSVGVHNITGLSDGAIEVLKAHKNDDTAKIPISIINFLLEQEIRRPEPYPYSYENDFTTEQFDETIKEHGKKEGKKIIDKMMKEAEAVYWEKYEETLADWRLEGYVQVLSKISDYLKVKLDDRQTYKISTDQIEQTEAADLPSVKTIVEISGNSIIDTVLLSEIQDMLKNLKEKYHTKRR